MTWFWALMARLLEKDPTCRQDLSPVEGVDPVLALQDDLERRARDRAARRVIAIANAADAREAVRLRRAVSMQAMAMAPRYPESRRRYY